jgi:hypothetical protein
MNSLTLWQLLSFAPPSPVGAMGLAFIWPQPLALLLSLIAFAQAYGLSWMIP